MFVLGGGEGGGSHLNQIFFLIAVGNEAVVGVVGNVAAALDPTSLA
jgi:hypothetical protein